MSRQSAVWHRCLMSNHVVSRQYFPLPLEDYLLGLSDLTGELMRYAISAISRRGGRTKAQDVCTFVRSCRAGQIASFSHDACVHPNMT